MKSVIITLSDNDWEAFKEYSNAALICNDTMVDYMESCLLDDVTALPENVIDFIQLGVASTIERDNFVRDLLIKEGYIFITFTYNVLSLKQQIVVNMEVA